MATKELNLTSSEKVKVYLDGRVIAEGVKAATLAAGADLYEALNDLVAGTTRDGALTINLIEFARRLHVARVALRAARGETP
jgi:antitoxin component of MazEF toxin-antitoxin module